MNENKDIKTALPKLRFPEFIGKGEWISKQLKDFAIFSKGKGIAKSDIVEDGTLQCIRYGELYTRYTEIIDNVFSSTNLREIDLVLSRSNDVIIPSSGETAIDIATASCVLKDGVALGGDLNIIRSNENGVFLSYYLNSAKKNDIAKKAQGIVIVHLYLEQLKTLNVDLPSVKEQTKIAECLSSLDDVISGVSDKILALKEYKKGLMQQLFPAEGKTTPAYRFPEFQNDGEWLETTLDAELNYENGKAHENDISSNGHYIVVNSKFISTDGNVRKFTDTPYCLANENDILIVLSDVPNGRAIAKCFIVDESDRYTVNQRVCKLSTKGVNSQFLYYILNRNAYFLSFDDGVKQTNLKKDDVLKCPLIIPNDPKEQQKIATTLSSIDNLIEAENSHLDQLKVHKKGLMQQLFPNLNE